MRLPEIVQLIPFLTNRKRWIHTYLGTGAILPADDLRHGRFEPAVPHSFRQEGQSLKVQEDGLSASAGFTIMKEVKLICQSNVLALDRVCATIGNSSCGGLVSACEGHDEPSISAPGSESHPV